MLNKYFLILSFLFVSLSVQANDNQIVKTRFELGDFFNLTLQDMKKSFQTIESNLSSQKLEFKDLRVLVDQLKNNSKVKESNPKLLKQAKKKMPNCDYTQEDLVWDNSNGWICKKAYYSSDCVAEKGYIREEISEDNYICKYNGKYKVEKAGWGLCDNSKGEKYEQWKCLMNNTDSGDYYEVEKVYCANEKKPVLHKKACGPKGGDSSCSCPPGYYYSYSNGKGKCIHELKIRSLSGDMGVSKRCDNEGNCSVTWSPHAGWWNHGCRGHCKQNKYLEIDSDGIKAMNFSNVRYREYAWSYINGRFLYSGINASGDYTGKSGCRPKTTSGGRYPCPSSHSGPPYRNGPRHKHWVGYPNINIKTYLKPGKNTFSTLIVSDRRSVGTFNFTAKVDTSPTPECTIN